MAANTHYDVLIVGGGQAGIPLAYALTKAGKRVGLAERKDLGGSCVNFGCTPTKAVIASARVAHLARRGTEFGLRIPTVEIDFPAVLERAKDVLMASRRKLDSGLEKSENPKLLRDHARLDGRDGKAFRLRVGPATITADQVVLDTGTRTLIPPIEGLSEVDFIHAGNWLDRPQLPEHLAMIGGGAIGLEMAQFYCRMGSRVTVVENAQQIAGHEDADVASALQKLLESEGIDFRLNTPIKHIERRENGLVLKLGKDSSSELKVSHLFVATGRQPNTEDLGLETVGVNVSKRSIVEVNQRSATNVEGVWVAGDIRGGPMFTHTSWDDYRILLSQIVGDGSRTTARVVPYAIFTDPDLGRVGMTETEARQAGKPVKVGQFEIRSNGKAREIGETEGFIKVVVDAASGQVLGAAVLASGGSELVHMYIDLMNAKAPYATMRDAIYIHPTLAEAIQSAVSGIE
jgi:pyruvate/2-oxoglutarate dehydrogenase complex dihydrolipoamide dehydrogenase (E3) component